MTKPHKIAIFDLDYTLTKRGTWGRFTWQLVKSRPHLWIPLLVSALLTQRRYKKGLIERVEVKKAMMRYSMKGRSKTALEMAAKKFAAAEVPNKLRPGGLRKLKEYQAAGCKVIIISAAIDILVKEIAILLNVEDFLATDMDWTDDGKVKIGFASPNCYGQEKVHRFNAYLKERPELQNLPRIMYSDSHSDIYLMKLCDEAVAVHPSAKLKKLASEYGYPVGNWDN